MTYEYRRLVGWAHADLARGFDRKWKSQGFLATIGTLAFFFPFSLFFVAGGFLPADFGWMSSAIIILSGIATLFSELRSVSVRTAIRRFVVIAGLLCVVEFVGVNTGLPFGVYTYTKELRLLVAGVPVAISIAWYCTVINAWRIAEHISSGMTTGGAVVTAMLAGFLTLGLDIALEPMAGFVQKYWLWASDSIPLQNYVSWFILSTVAVYLLSRKGRVPENGPARFRGALFLFGFHFILFVLTILVNGYFVAAAIALAVVLFPFALLVPGMRLPGPDMARR
jgi:uncharacterized membrane protein